MVMYDWPKVVQQAYMRSGDLNLSLLDPSPALNTIAGSTRYKRCSGDLESKY